MQDARATFPPVTAKDEVLSPTWDNDDNEVGSQASKGSQGSRLSQKRSREDKQRSRSSTPSGLNVGLEKWVRSFPETNQASVGSGSRGQGQVTLTPSRGIIPIHKNGGKGTGSVLVVACIILP